MQNVRAHGRRMVVTLLLGASLAGPGRLLAQESPKYVNELPGTYNALKDSKLGIRRYAAVQNLVDTTAQIGTSEYLIDLYVPTDDLLGATLRPIDEVLRAQLEIPAKQGVLVASIRPDGASAQAGLQQNDILLTLADKPLAGSDDLTRLLQEAGKSTVALKLMRAGKPVTLQIQPLYKVTLAPAPQEKSEYFIGVSLEPLDDSARAQLGIRSGSGVVITDVIKDSPAEKAGLKKFDVAIELGDTVVSTPEAFAKWVQLNKEKPSKLTLYRAGKPITIPVTAAVRKTQAAAERDLARLAVVQMTNQISGQQYLSILKQEEARRMDQLEKELSSLRDAVNKLTETLDKAKKE